MMDVFAVQLDSLWQDKQANHARVRELLADVEIPRKLIDRLAGNV